MALTDQECSDLFGEWARDRCLKRNKAFGQDPQMFADKIKSAPDKGKFKADTAELQWLVKTLEDPDWS